MPEVTSTPKKSAFEQNILDPVAVVLDRERHLKMDLKAMKFIQRETGLNPWMLSNWNAEVQNPEVLSVFLFACLRWEDPALKLEDIDDMPGIELSNMPYIISKLGELWGISMPEPGEDEEKDQDPNVSPPPGQTSGASEGTT